MTLQFLYVSVKIHNTDHQRLLVTMKFNVSTVCPNHVYQLVYHLIFLWTDISEPIGLTEHASDVNNSSFSAHFLMQSSKFLKDSFTPRSWAQWGHEYSLASGGGREGTVSGLVKQTVNCYFSVVSFQKLVQ